MLLAQQPLAGRAQTRGPGCLHQAQAACNTPLVSRQRAPASPSFRPRAVQSTQSPASTVLPEQQISGLSPALDSLKWDARGLITVIAQHADTGEVLMQAFADRAAVTETLQTRLATFYSRSRKERWCKGETSGHFINVSGVYVDCDHDSLVYLGEPIGPACHTGARTCWFTALELSQPSEEAEQSQSAALRQGGLGGEGAATTPLPTLQALEQTIIQRGQQASSNGAKPSWTAKLLADPKLLCSKVREEAGELCQTLEQDEGRERAASEMADLLYHAMVLLKAQGVEFEEVLKLLRARFGTSGVAEKAARKQQ